MQPSRHYGKDSKTNKEEFMKNLCPSWADRVLYNEKLSDLFRHVSFFIQINIFFINLKKIVFKTKAKKTFVLLLLYFVIFQAKYLLLILSTTVG